METRAALVNLGWAGSNAARFVRYRAALSNPAAAQARLLRQYLRDNADSDFGRRHQFARVRTVEEFRAAVPLSTYEDYAEHIDRIRTGEANVLTREPVRRLVPSGGSTRAQKLVPYTARLQDEFNRGIGPWICDLFGRDPGLMAGPAYWSVSPAVQPPDGADASAVPVGFDDDSAYVGGVWQRLIGAAFAVPSAVRHIQDVVSFRHATLLHLLRCRELRLISVWHPSFLSLLLEDLEPRFESLLRDLRDGGHGAPRRKRVAELERIGPRELEAIWPRLGMISCWADAHAALHVDSLRRFFPHVPVQPKGLIATEAFVTLPFAKKHPLAVLSHFFEFLDDRGQALLADELERGGEYRVVVTTGGGLYRYCLNDRVVVDGVVGRTPSLRFVGKEDHVSDRFGEKLSEGFVGNVLRRLFDRRGLRPRFAMLAPEERGGRTRYVLFVEAEELSGTLAAELDEALAENPHYRYCRDLGQLAEAEVFCLRGGGYAAYVAQCRLRGQRLGDVKPSPLSRHAGWAEVFARSGCGASWNHVAAPVHSVPSETA